MTARSLSRFVTNNDQGDVSGPNDWLGEHRLRAVLEVRAGAAVAEVSTTLRRVTAVGLFVAGPL